MPLSEKFATIRKILRMAEAAHNVEAAANYRALAAELLALAMDERAS